MFYLAQLYYHLARLSRCLCGQIDILAGAEFVEAVCECPSPIVRLSVRLIIYPKTTGAERAEAPFDRLKTLFG